MYTPMETNCALFLANVFLHVYEYEYLQKLVILLKLLNIMMIKLYSVE